MSKIHKSCCRWSHCCKCINYMYRNSGFKTCESCALENAQDVKRCEIFVKKNFDFVIRNSLSILKWRAKSNDNRIRIRTTFFALQVVIGLCRTCKITTMNAVAAVVSSRKTIPNSNSIPSIIFVAKDFLEYAYLASSSLQERDQACHRLLPSTNNTKLEALAPWSAATISKTIYEIKIRRFFFSFERKTVTEEFKLKF